MKNINLNIFRNLKEMVLIILGIFVSALAINSFLVPLNLLSGGVSGIAILLNKVYSLKIGLMIFLLNIPLFILAYFKLDKKFTLYSFIIMISFSFILEVTKDISKLIYVDDIMLASVFGGVLSGIGLGLVLRYKASFGGLDIAGAIFKKKFNIDVGTTFMSINAVIVLVGSMIFGIEEALYTLISMHISNVVLENVLEILNTQSALIIISDKNELIAEKLMKSHKKGVTYLKGEGGYTGKDKKIIYCIVPKYEVAKVKEIAANIDEKAFISINSIQEVKGSGFRERFL